VGDNPLHEETDMVLNPYTPPKRVDHLEARQGVRTVPANAGTVRHVRVARLRDPDAVRKPAAS